MDRYAAGVHYRWSYRRGEDLEGPKQSLEKALKQRANRRQTVTTTGDRTQRETLFKPFHPWAMHSSFHQSMLSLSATLHPRHFSRSEWVGLCASSFTNASTATNASPNNPILESLEKLRREQTPLGKRSLPEYYRFVIAGRGTLGSRGGTCPLSTTIRQEPKSPRVRTLLHTETYAADGTSRPEQDNNHFGLTEMWK